jgi:hypothetical protein
MRTVPFFSEHWIPLATADLLDLVNVIAQIYEPSTELLMERPQS